MVDNGTPKDNVLKFNNKTVAFVFTEAKIQKLEPRKKTFAVKDDESGMYCYVTPTGSRIYKTYKKINGTPERITIGDAKVYSLKEARKIHRQNVTDIDKGFHPRYKQKKENEPTIEQAIDTYLKKGLQGLNPRHNLKTSMTLRSLANSLPNHIKKRSFTELELNHWEKLYDDNDATGKWSKNYNTFRMLNSVWKSMGYTEGRSPKEMLTSDRGKQINFMRDRLTVYLSPDPSKEQLGQFIHHAVRITYGDFRTVFTERDLMDVGKPIPEDFRPYDVYDPKPNPQNEVYLHAVLFILLTGFRLRNALDLEWKDVDFKAKTVSIQKLKGHDKVVYFKMTKQIHWLLQFRQLRMRNHNCKYVFPSNRTMKKTVTVLNKFIPAVLEEMNNDKVPHVTAHALRRSCANISAYIGHESVYQDVILMHSAKKLADRNYVERDAHKHLEKLSEVNDFLDNRITEVLMNNQCNFGAFDKYPVNENGEEVSRLEPIDEKNKIFPSGIAFLCGQAKKLNVMEGFYFDTWDNTYPEPEFDDGESY
jgi:integrase